MRFARWMTKATTRYSEYIILIASPRQKRLSERASVLRYTYKIVLHNEEYRNDRTNKKNQGRSQLVRAPVKNIFEFFQQGGRSKNLYI
jgi:hypothetical protein